MTKHNANNNNILATITILNLTIHNDYNEQCMKWYNNNAQGDKLKE